MRPEEIIDRYFRAMRQGPTGQEDLLALFADEAVYDEPFTDPGTPAVGKRAIGERLRTGWEEPPPDMELDVLNVEVDGNRAEVRWECRSPAFPAPSTVLTTTDSRRAGSANYGWSSTNRRADARLDDGVGAAGGIDRGSTRR